mmetsp:Transcript_1571/g.2304  ORF Transcript_1571/g.2304 Transcript_1571/m.2304 type:complete len:227 (-) Transcript_1571:105-785(-)
METMLSSFVSKCKSWLFVSALLLINDLSSCVSGDSNPPFVYSNPMFSTSIFSPASISSFSSFSTAGISLQLSLFRLSSFFSMETMLSSFVSKCKSWLFVSALLLINDLSSCVSGDSNPPFVYSNPMFSTSIFSPASISSFSSFSTAGISLQLSLFRLSGRAGSGEITLVKDFTFSSAAKSPPISFCDFEKPFIDTNSLTFTASSMESLPFPFGKIFSSSNSSFSSQ